MEQWMQIRRRVLVDGVSKRQILRETGMHWTTLEKMLAHPEPPGYQRTAPPNKPKIGPYLDRIKQILESDKAMAKKQRHTVKRIWQVLQSEGFTGGYTIVKDAVRELRLEHQEVFMPLSHPPGQAQVDFGEAVVHMNGKLRKVEFFTMALPHSDAVFTMAFDRECTETFWEGHVRAFDFFKGVPTRITYDNTKVCVKQIVGPRERRLTDGFMQLVSHYLFHHHFCLVRRANEKGVVEALIKYVRQNFFVPVLRVRDFEELNGILRQMCQDALAHRVWGQKATKAEVLERDRAAFRSVPMTRFDACRVRSTHADSEALVRFDTNDYSVPVEYAHHPVVVRAYFDRVVIAHKHQVAASHKRCWDREQQIFNPLHYLPLLERKPYSFDHGRPFEQLQLPACFDTLRRRLEDERDDGTREYVRVLRLMEQHPQPDLTAAIEKALRMRTHGRDEVAQYLTPPEPWELTTFKLDGRPHLRQVKVQCADLRGYSSLLQVGG
jgi:transposase